MFIPAESMPCNRTCTSYEPRDWLCRTYEVVGRTLDGEWWFRLKYKDEQGNSVEAWYSATECERMGLVKPMILKGKNYV